MNSKKQKSVGQNSQFQLSKSRALGFITCKQFSGGELFESESLNESASLFVNVASECGYTKQYQELQELNDAFDNFQVIGLPCNDFVGQEPGDLDTIQACGASFNLTFPLMAKVYITDELTRSSMYQSMREATACSLSGTLKNASSTKKACPWHSSVQRLRRFQMRLLSALMRFLLIPLPLNRSINKHISRWLR
ncbi:MAG: hypothetical protein CMA02_02325 [Euryarchaeota archaeon]|nr:hypothetical protein [Euryarchaeota archaeon]